jgi:hypothetical protein
MCKKLESQAGAKVEYVWTEQATQSDEVKAKIPNFFKSLRAGDAVNPEQMQLLQTSGAIQSFNGLYIREAHEECKVRLSKVYTRIYYMAKKLKQLDQKPDAVEAEFDEVEKQGKSVCN